VDSPDGMVVVAVGTRQDRGLAYSVGCGGRGVIEWSPLGITVDGQRLGRGVVLGEPVRWTLDFMDSESKAVIDFYTAVLEEAAEYELMVDFHGANKPTGESRPYPNEMTREGIRGLEYNKWSALPAAHYATLPFTRLLAGHGDFTPCTFNPEMLKGTTFALQLATAICYTSPLMFYADEPERYLRTPAVDVIKAIPSVWDETIVLPGSELGRLAAIARRRGPVWFVGLINGGAARRYELDLDFLGEGRFQSVQLGDNPTRADDLIRSTSVVSASTSLAVAMNAGGGSVVMLRPVN
jgi:alpha-glucosidase